MLKFFYILISATTLVLLLNATIATTTKKSIKQLYFGKDKKRGKEMVLVIMQNCKQKW
jgi:hypothetical protein